MRNLRLRARVYVLMSCVIATLISLAQLWVFIDKTPSVNAWHLGGVCLVAAALSLFRASGSSSQENYDVALTMYGFTLAAMGVTETIIVIGVTHLAIIAFGRHRLGWHYHAFNVSSFVIAAWIGAGANSAAHQIGGDHPAVAAFGFLVMVAAFVFGNHAHVAGVQWSADGTHPRASSLFAWSSLYVDATMLGIGTMCAVVYTVNPYAVMLGLAPLYLMYSVMRLPLLERQAKTDAKTGLYHGKQFAELAQQELVRARRFNRPLTLVMADLDLLRDINNKHGHLAGDVAIKAVGEILRGYMREGELVARFGGEEFAMLFVEHSLSEALPRVEQVRAAIAACKPPLASGINLPISMSFGVTQRDASDEQLDQLIERADQALYRAKNNGRNCVRTSDHAENEMAVIPPGLLRYAPIATRLGEGHSDAPACERKLPAHARN